MDLVRLAEEIAAVYTQATDPSDGVVREAAEENDADKTWAVLLRPVGEWFYLLGYIPEKGWALGRVPRLDDRPLERSDVEVLGLYEMRVQAAATALALMEGQP